LIPPLRCDAVCFFIARVYQTGCQLKNLFDARPHFH
jgi:hypothetical protein